MTTVELAERVVTQNLAEIPPHALKEAKRSILNLMGVAIGAAAHPMCDMVERSMRPFAGPVTATVWGRKTTADIFTATLLNGISAHIFDYDDTLLDTVLHPSAPVLPALFAFAEMTAVKETDLLSAFVLGIEAEQRIAQMVYPSHYDRGWHITGSVGAFGAAAAVGKLIGLDPRRMAFAFGLAATQPVGLREMFGSYTKPFHPGKAALNGLQAALLAQQGFTSSLFSLEAPRGFALVTSEDPNFAKLTQNWGDVWQICHNSYKPFPCGIVIHPAIDSAIQLKRRHQVAAEDIEQVELDVHPLVLELTGKKTPKDGLEAKFSVYHCVAAGLIDGQVGLAQFADSRVNAPDTLRLRQKVSASADPDLAEDQVRIRVDLKSGKRLELFIEHCVGSISNPMADEQLETKFCDATMGILTPERQEALIECVWEFGVAGSLAKLLELCVPD